jgi:hypothetical protein
MVQEIARRVGAAARRDGFSELGWFQDGSYTVIVLGNYDLPGASAIYQKLIGFLALQ